MVWLDDNIEVQVHCKILFKILHYRAVKANQDNQGGIFAKQIVPLPTGNPKERLPKGKNQTN